MTTRVSVTDLVPMSALTSRVITPEGYMIAPANLARTGVQEYLASELGLDKAMGMDARQRIRLHRPADEVFAPASLASFDGKPVTYKHPPEMVTADTWKKYSVGDVRKVCAAGDMMACEMVVRDAAAVKAVQSGTSKLSNGYTFDMDMTPGKTAAGDSYDGVQRNIIGNHIAIVDSPRGGSACRIGDETNNQSSPDTSSKGDRPMAIKRVKIGFDSKPVMLDLEDSQAELVVMLDESYKEAVKIANDATATSTTRVKELEAMLVSEKAATAKMATDHATAVADLSKKVKSEADIEALATARAATITDAQVETLATERQVAIDGALKLVPKFEHAKKTVPQIRTEVISAVVAGDDESLKAIALAGLGGLDAAKADAAVSKIVFATLVAAKPRTVADEDERRTVVDALGTALNGGATTGAGRGAYKPKPIIGMDLVRYRESHGGKNPPEMDA